MSVRVLVVDEDDERFERMDDALRGAGYTVLRSRALRPLADQIGDLRPDLVVVDLASPDRDALDALRLIAHGEGRPVVLFSPSMDEAAIAEAVGAGVTAYAFRDVPAERLKPLLDLAVAQFRQFRALQDELDLARRSLQDRKLIDRAKGILMRQRGLDEDAAYKALRKMAMDRGQRLADIADQLIAMARLLEK